VIVQVPSPETLTPVTSMVELETATVPQVEVL